MLPGDGLTPPLEHTEPLVSSLRSPPTSCRSSRQRAVQYGREVGKGRDVRRKPNVTYSAPVGSVDLAAETPDGTPYSIWPCPECLPWHVEVIRDGQDVVVREWHAIECSVFQELIQP